MLPHAEGLKLAIRPERSTVRVCTEGALDVATAPLLGSQIEELRDAGFRRLIVDLGGLEFMDSWGLRLLLETDAAARRNGFTIEIAPGPPTVQRVFELTRTRDHLRFTTD